MSVQLHELSLRYPGGPVVIDRLSTRIEAGEFVAVLGASGCGKSSLLNIIAGLQPPTAGWVEVPADGAAFMFQDANLLPWLNAAQNVELALKLAGSRRTSGDRTRTGCLNWCSWARRAAQTP